MKKWILELLGVSAGDPAAGDPAAGDPASAQHTAAVRRIVTALEALEPQRAQFLAAFAYLLGRVAHADLEISDEEMRHMEDIVERWGELPPEQARLVVEFVRHEHLDRGSTQNFQVAREFRKISSKEERRDLLDCLFAVSAADDEISHVEEQQVRQIAEELGFSPREFVDCRSAWNEKRSVIRHLKGK